jgi:carboxypeptidase Taq
MTDSPLSKLRQRWRQIHDLQEAQGLLDWDQQTMMPKRGAEQRGQQAAALATVAHEKLIAPELGDLLAAAEAETAGGSDGDPDLSADLRELRRERERAVRLPAELVAEQARVCTLAQSAWEEAHTAGAFAPFAPHLERVLQVMREVAAALRNGEASAYDVLLDEYEPGMNEAALEQIFSDLRPPLVDLLGRLQGATHQVRTDVLRGHYPVKAQERFLRDLVARMGLDLEAGRMDRSVHPFTAGTLRDVRITVRYDEETPLPALFGAIHEAGHALYEQGLDPQRFRDPSGGYCSLGIHESQSRLWENLLGRSLPFWRFFLPRLKEAIPGALAGVALEAFHEAINAVQPSLIRVEADEVTYNLHIILRFQLERALVSGDLTVADLPGAWREQCANLLGLEPSSDSEGALQDVHWSAGLFGYFPTYALGNLYGAQFLEAMRGSLGDLDDLMTRGELAPIKGWLNEAIHRRGRRHLAPELCQQVCGAPLTSDALLQHLERKYTAIYKI